MINTFVIQTWYRETCWTIRLQ